jgi:hypothetical protein
MRARHFAAVLGAWTLLVATAAEAMPINRLEFLGEARIPKGLSLRDTTVGGLSGAAWEGAGSSYVVLSDDRSDRGPARFYTISVKLEGGRLTANSLRVDGVTFLRDLDQKPFPSGGIDPEGIVWTIQNTAFIVSEGDAEKGLAPFVREFGASGFERRRLDLPAYYLPTPDGSSGVRRNLGFEAVSLAPDGRRLIVGLENALAQDGPAAALGTPSPVRLLELDAVRGELMAEYLYWTEPISKRPTPADGTQVNGLSEMLAFDGGDLLMLEREYVAGQGHSIRLYASNLRDAQNILGRASIAADAKTITPVSKTLMLDFAELGIVPENIEALALGPNLPDGRRLMLAFADDNFADDASNQVLAFAVSRSPLTVAQASGDAGGLALIPGERLWSLTGLVEKPAKGDGFRLKSLASVLGRVSKGEVVIEPARGLPKVRTGDRVEVDGVVVAVEGGKPRVKPTAVRILVPAEP